jgi:hypothetical protein
MKFFRLLFFIKSMVFHVGVGTCGFLSQNLQIFFNCLLPIDYKISFRIFILEEFEC